LDVLAHCDDRLMNDLTYVALTGDLTVVLYFGMGELYVARSRLATSIETEHEGLPVRVTFPDEQGYFQDPQPPPSPLGLMWIGGRDNPHALVVVHRVQVCVDMGRGLGDEGPGNAELALIRTAEPVAGAVIRGIIDWARVNDRQVWLSPPHTRPRPRGAAWLVNQSGEASRGYNTEGGVIVALGKDELPSGEIGGWLKPDEVPTAESLLAEARWAVWPKYDADTKRAVLFAAIALEIKTPQVLASKSEGMTSDVLALVFSRLQDVPMSVNFLLNNMASVVFSSSLKEHNGHLSRQIKALYELRNGIAHRGETPDVKAAREGVTAVESTFKWLDSHLAG
jgi:hypothetical protein